MNIHEAKTHLSRLLERVADGERVVIRAGVETLGGYSAHADRQGLLNFATRMRHWPGEVRLVHGEREAKQQLAAALRARYAARKLPVKVRT